ncbi:hypothetical protein NM208_g2738 [Fusarium decemcellulare]|uniref:Uncharacterized protein n=1 Tax=Fusarium decemcellulare TaxID=57161 RepID=A0ACC1SRM3_9HYPO|nr:hypothetical protein NM208_g2738 [Fusarium decemcellulare]
MSTTHGEVSSNGACPIVESDKPFNEFQQYCVIDTSPNINKHIQTSQLLRPAIAAILAIVGTAVAYQGQPATMARRTILEHNILHLRGRFASCFRRGSGLNITWSATMVMLAAVRGDHSNFCGRISFVAAFGAFLTIAAVTVGPFTQQLLSYEDCNVPAAVIGRNPALAAINAGIVGSPCTTRANCPAGNCTFSRDFTTLGFCSACQDISIAISISSESCFVFDRNAETGPDYYPFSRQPCFKNSSSARIITQLPTRQDVFDTCKARLLYEIQGPLYYNSDVVARLEDIIIEQADKDKVSIHNVGGLKPPPTTQVGITAKGGYQAEAHYFFCAILDESKLHCLKFRVNGRCPENPKNQDAATVDVQIFAQSRTKESLSTGNFFRLVTDVIMQSYPGAIFAVDARQANPKPYYEYFDFIYEQSTYKTTNPVDLASMGPTRNAPLGYVVHAGFGDKWSDANVGFFVRHDHEWDWLRSLLTVEKNRDLLGDDDNGKPIFRFELKNISENKSAKYECQGGKMPWQKIDHQFAHSRLDYNSKHNFQPCIQVSVFFKKIDSIDYDTFFGHRQTVHADLAVAPEAFRNHIHHQTSEMKERARSLREGVFDYDGCAQLWVRTWDDWLAFYNSKEDAVALSDDCNRFLALPTTYMIGYENIVVGGASKSLSGKDGIDIESHHYLCDAILPK